MLIACCITCPTGPFSIFKQSLADVRLNQNPRSNPNRPLWCKTTIKLYEKMKAITKDLM